MEIEPGPVWNLMLRQATGAGKTEMDGCSLYLIIGQKIAAACPSIKLEVAHSWVSVGTAHVAWTLLLYLYSSIVSFMLPLFISVALQQRPVYSRIRHFRCQDKNESTATGQGTTGAKKWPFFKPATPRSSQKAQNVVSPEDDHAASCVRAQKGMGQASDNRNTNHIKLIIEQTTEHRAVLLVKDETGRLLPSLMHIHSLRMAILWVHPGCHSIINAIVSCVVVVSTEEVAAIRFELGMVVIECKICFLNL